MKKYLLYAAQNYSYAILRPLQAAIRARGAQAKWFFDGEEINPDYLQDDEERLLSVKQVKAYKPDVVLVPGNIVPNFIPGLKVAVFHGFNSEKRSDNDGHFRIRGCFDLYCTQGPNTTLKFKELAQQHGYFRVIETGWPAVDPLFKGVAEPRNNRRPTILFCSTFSRKLTAAPHLLDTVKQLAQQGNWQWLVQFHPKMDKDVVVQYKAIQNDNLEFIETDNVIPLLHQADVMLCDTSSVLIMFLLLRKPVVTFNNSKPAPHLLDINEKEKLEQSLATALQQPADLMQHIDQFIAQTHPNRDGDAANRVLNAVEEVLAGKHSVKRSKPLNLFRNLKARKRLGYWGL